MSHPGGLTRDHVVWAYRLLLDREPENEDVIGPKLAGSRDTRELRHHLLTSAEFRANNRDYAHTNDRTIVISELGGPGGPRLFVDLADHVIGLPIVRGQYEPDEMAFVRGVVKPGDCALDVGAHIGFFTIQLAALVGASGHVHAFEPVDANADLLARSVGENRFEGRVTLRRAAVGAANGYAMLTFPRETLNTGGAYLLPNGSPPLAGNLKKEIPVVALDAVELRRPVRFIKMDVEGAEPAVLEGARRLLAEDRPVILSELHPTQLHRASGKTPADFLAQLDRMGYGAHRLKDGRPGEAIRGVDDDQIISAVLLPT